MEWLSGQNQKQTGPNFSNEKTTIRAEPIDETQLIGMRRSTIQSEMTDRSEVSGDQESKLSSYEESLLKYIQQLQRRFDTLETETNRVGRNINVMKI